MGKTPLADIPGNHFLAIMGTHAAVASNAAAARLADAVFVAPANIKILSAWRINQGTAEASASNATRYRDFVINNGGTSGTATTSLASVRSGTTVGPVANASQALTLSGTATATAGAILWCSAKASIGAASDDSTALVASVVQIAYELL